jgi:N-acetylmuramoyl-L-alanine amidase
MTIFSFRHSGLRRLGWVFGAALILCCAATPARAQQPHAFPRDACDTVIALDIGHTLARPGATSARGRTEYSFNLALGRAVLGVLLRAGYRHSFLVDASGSDIALSDRTAIARAHKADFFIALHHDSVQPHYLRTWVVERRSQRFSDLFQGYSIFISTTSKQATANLELARGVAAQLRMRGLQPTLHHAADIPGERRRLLDPDLGIYRFDELVVLRTATMPAILLEAGVIVNREEELRIDTDSYRSSVGEAILAGFRGMQTDPCSKNFGHD